MTGAVKINRNESSDAGQSEKRKFSRAEKVFHRLFLKFLRPMSLPRHCRLWPSQRRPGRGGRSRAVTIFLPPPPHQRQHHPPRPPRRAARARSRSRPRPGGELWRVRRIDRVSDWSASPVETRPNPLSHKEHVSSSWFAGENDAVAVRVRIDALETIDEGCLLYDEEEFECDRPRRLAFVLAGPRAEIAFDPSDCRAAVPS